MIARNKVLRFQIYLTGLLLAVGGVSHGAEPKLGKNEILSSSSTQPCLMALRVGSDDSYVVHTRLRGRADRTMQIGRGDTATLRKQIAASCESGADPVVSIEIDGSAPFQSLVNVVSEMVHANIVKFEVLTDTSRVPIRIPPGAHSNAQSEISLTITKQSIYGVDNKKIPEVSSRDLARLLADQVSSKKCCFVVIYADEKAPVQAFLFAVAATTEAGIDDYWVAGRPNKTIANSPGKVGYAEYYKDMRKRIEKIGTLNFPEKDGRKMYGDVVVYIPIFQDGTIYEKDGGVRVEKSSGRPDLDKATLAIVRRAAPFGSFPPKSRSSDPDDIWVFITRFSFLRKGRLEGELLGQ